MKVIFEEDENVMIINKKKLHEMYVDNMMTQQQLADTFCVSLGTINKVLKKFGLDASKIRKIRAEENEEIRKNFRISIPELLIK